MVKRVLWGLLAFALALAFTWGSLPGTDALILGAAAALLAFFFLGHGGHSHHGVASFDQLAQRSPLGRVHPGIKILFSLGALFLCAGAKSPWPPLLAGLVLGGVTVWKGKVPFRRYLSFLALPLSFIALSALVMIFHLSPVPAGLLDIPLGPVWLSATAAGRQDAILTFCRAMGGVSCLYFLSLSTPLPEIIHCLGKIHVPQVVLELMFLIYRFLFLLWEEGQRRNQAAQARMGQGRFGRRVQSFALVAQGLLGGAILGPRGAGRPWRAGGMTAPSAFCRRKSLCGCVMACGRFGSCSPGDRGLLAGEVTWNRSYCSWRTFAIPMAEMLLLWKGFLSR